LPERKTLRTRRLDRLLSAAQSQTRSVHAFPYVPTYCKANGRAALTILYPFILAKTRQQVEGGDSSGTSLRSVLANAYEGHVPPSATSSNIGRARVPGVTGLYQGLEMKILKGFLSQGVTFLVKGR